MQNPFIIGKKVYLRPVEVTDMDLLVRWNSNPEARYSFFIGLPTNARRQSEYLENMYKEKDHLLFIIVALESNEPVGITGFWRIDWVGRAATYGLIIGDSKNWGKGYGSETTRWMVDYGFQTLNLNRIQLHVWAGNTAALKAYKKSGFKREGLLRQAMFHDGKYEDFYVMSILQKEFLAFNRKR
jgi:diamine N-acetyltransferase